MYKRRARFLFLGSVPLTEWAVACVDETAREWVEAQVLIADATPDVRQEWLLWADVCVLLEDLPAPAGKVCRRWLLDPTNAKQARERLLVELAGVVGGMRLLAQADGRT